MEINKKESVASGKTRACAEIPVNIKTSSPKFTVASRLRPNYLLRKPTSSA